MEKLPIFPEEVFHPIKILRNLVYMAKCEADDSAKVRHYMAMAEFALEDLTTAGTRIPFSSTLWDIPSSES